MNFDEIDHKLLAALQADANTNIKTLAATLGLTKTPIYDRIRRYDQDQVIEKQVAVLNRRTVNIGMVIFCSVSLETQQLKHLDEFRAAVMDIPEVMECYLMGGANDFLLKVVVKDLQAYHEFSSGKLASLAHVQKIQSTFVLDEVKRSTVFPIYD